MKTGLMLVVSALITLPAFVYAATDNCGQARDPIRCTAYQSALKACAGIRGAAKRSCLESNMPPVDCSKSENPQRCEVAEKAKRTCAGLQGKAQEQCRRQQNQTRRKA